MSKKQAAALTAIGVALLDHLLVVRPAEQEGAQTAHALRQVALLVSSQRAQLEQYEYVVCLPPSPR